MTHERNALIWAITHWSMKLIIAIAAYVYIICTLSGCGAETPTYRYTDNQSADEMIMAGFAVARCNDLGLKIKVVWTDDPYYIDGAMYGIEGRIKAAAWALTRSKRVAVYTGTLDHGWSYDVFNGLAKHECCHIKLGHTLNTPESEGQANACVIERWGDVKN